MRLTEALANSVDHMANAFAEDATGEWLDIEILVIPAGKAWCIRVFDPEEGMVAEDVPVTLEDINRDWPGLNWRPITKEELSPEEREVKLDGSDQPAE